MLYNMLKRAMLPASGQVFNLQRASPLCSELVSRTNE